MLYVCVYLAVLVFVLFLLIHFRQNLEWFCVDLEASKHVMESVDGVVSVLIPARDEGSSIEACVRSVLASEGVAVEVIVLDDHSEDATASIVGKLSNQDSRVRLVSGKPLPDGWNGKQHACHQLAGHATGGYFLFLDADVRLNPRAVEQLRSYHHHHGLSLTSAFPFQETGTWMEKLLIPLMHYILLCFLPFRGMRESRDPSFAAGCGQLFFTNPKDYSSAGGHQAIKGSRHDGVTLPRAFRRADLTTDVIDGTNIARCRMYTSATEVVRGLLKNATEGIASPLLIVPFTVMLLVANVVPWGLLFGAFLSGNSIAVVLCILLVGFSLTPRMIAAARFSQSKLGALFQPIAILIFLLLQWIALILSVAGFRVRWRGRD